MTTGFQRARVRQEAGEEPVRWLPRAEAGYMLSSHSSWASSVRAMRSARYVRLVSCRLRCWAWIARTSFPATLTARLRQVLEQYKGGRPRPVDH